MPAGLRIINDAGTVQVDENYFNFVLAQKVDGLTVAHEEPAWAGSKIAFSMAGAFPLIAWQCSEIIMMQGFYESGGTWHFVLRCAGPADTAYTLFAFAEPSTAAGVYGASGFEVMNTAGERVFHSSAKPARVSGSHGVSMSTAQTFDYTAGRQYATAMLRPAVEQVPRPAHPGPPVPPPYYVDTFYSGCRGHASGVTHGSWRLSAAGPFDGDTPFTPVQQSSSSFLVLDVTNY